MHLSRLLLSGILPLPFSLAACAQTPTTESPPAVVTPADDLVFADTLWLNNGRIKLGVSPSVGRITWFGYAGSENLLWVNPGTVDTPPDGDPGAWINYGGDKLWHSPQSSWAFFSPAGSDWPPDGSVDGEAWHVTAKTDSSITFRSPFSTVLGGHLERTIALAFQADDALRREGFDRDEHVAAAVRIVNRIHRTNASHLPAQAWPVTQIVPADQVVLFDRSEGRLPDGWFPFPNSLTEDGHMFEGEIDFEDGSVHWQPQPDAPKGKKLGALGSMMLAQFGDDVFVQIHDYDAEGVYPENSSMTLYVAGDYLELELLSPAETLEPGESLEHTVYWLLMNIAELPQER